MSTLLPWKHAHFIGIGGVGMSGLAFILLENGVTVSGSDQAPSLACRRLRVRGATVFTGHDRSHLPAEADLVVYSSAVTEENPERREADRRGLTSLRRGAFLARLATCYDTSVAVAGSHGKTTTTAMLAHILRENGKRPGYLVGGDIPAWPASAAAGAGRILVTEVDESDATQALMSSTYAVVTNVEDDHAWSVGGLEALEHCFREFAHRAASVVAWDTDTTRRLFSDHRDVSFVADTDIAPGLGLPLGGLHNRRNATLACRVARQLGVSPADSRAALASFPGVARRLTCHFRAPDGSLILLEDYAHHPTELRAVMQTFRNDYPHHALTVVFQPHRFERVKRYSTEFTDILGGADRVVVTAPFAAWRQDAALADPRYIATAIEACPASYWDGPLEKLAEQLCRQVRGRREPQLIAVVGAGDVAGVIPPLKERLVGLVLDRLGEDFKRENPDVEVDRSASWSALTTLGIGGARPLCARPADTGQLKRTITFANSRNLPVRVLGAGSNVVGTDSENPRLLLQLTTGRFSRWSHEGGTVTAGAGVLLPNLIRSWIDAGICPATAAPLAWIPGSAGGAVRMNAGAHGVTIGTLVNRVKGVDRNGRRWQARGDHIAWGYRETDIPADVILTEIDFVVVPEDSEKARRKLEETGSMRRASQPVGRTAGCAFRNAGNTSAGKLLDRCGAKNLATGACRISDKHANFFLCDDGATEEDMIDLILSARLLVARRTGVILAPEVCFAGSFSASRLRQSLRPLSVAVLMGGTSTERVVSLNSGAAVAKALRAAGHNVTEIDVTEQKLPALPRGTDVVFPALHGEFGEDGSIQKLLETADMPFVGSGSAASALIMDKIRTKQVLRQHGIPTPDFEILTDVDAPVTRDVAFPLVIKPATQGSTMGISRLRRPSGWWRRALRKAFRFDDTVLAEAYVDGHEITVGVLDGEPLPVIEIVPPADRMFDYDAKYDHKLGHTRYLCPPRHVSAAAQERARRYAAGCFRVLGARDMLRVDFIVDSRGEPWVLEANSIPGFTATSLLPKAAEAAGISFVELCARLAAANAGMVTQPLPTDTVQTGRIRC